MATFSTQLVQAPEGEPISLDEAKKHCELDPELCEHDVQLAAIVMAARQFVENQTGRQLLAATWDFYLDGIPCRDFILLPKPPLIEVESFKYIDSAGELQTWNEDSYRVTSAREPARLSPAWNASWPTYRRQTESIVVRYRAGYGAADAVPQALKQAILLLVGHWFVNREVAVGQSTKGIGFALDALLEQYAIGDEFLCYGSVS